VIMARQGVGYIVVVNPGEIRENFLQDIREQLMIPIRQMKRSGIEEEECIEVVKKCWKESS